MIQIILSDITEAGIGRLQDTGVAEDTNIKYKKELPGTRDKEKREFLADVSSFANTDGGDLTCQSFSENLADRM